MTMFAPIYYPYLALTDSCMHKHFLNRLNDLFSVKSFGSRMTCFWGTDGLKKKVISSWY